MKKFVLCAGYKCAKKDTCLRNIKHKEIKAQGRDTTAFKYLDALVCVSHRFKNYVPNDVYGSKSKFPNIKKVKKKKD